MTSIKKLLVVLYLLGPLLLILGGILIIPLFLGYYYQEGSLVYKSFYIPMFLSLITGFILSNLKIRDYRLTLTTSMLICGLAWFIFSLIGSIPFQIALDKSFIDSLFEAVSGFTTTGITVFQGLERMPRSILFWRSLMQWVGGLGILTFFLLITFRSEGEIWQLFTAESHKISTSRPVPNIFKSIQILWSIYIFFTLLEFFLLLLLQVDGFTAIIHSLTTLSTGGYSNFDSSLAHFQQTDHRYYILIEYVTIIFMLLGGINFLVHFKILSGNIQELFSNVELKHFFYIIFVAVAVILGGKLALEGIPDIPRFEAYLRKVIFQVVSITTTTGYGTEALTSDFFPVVARHIFLLLMLVGGCVGSTAGGFKVIRFVILNKLFVREIRKFHLPSRALLPISLNGNIISTEEILRIAGLFFAWLFLIFIGGIITAIFSDLKALAAMSGMFSAVGNIGPFYFSVDKMASLSPVIKITYIFGMLAGRLEILPLFVLFTKKAWK